jgi:hypothetical protein
MQEYAIQIKRTLLQIGLLAVTMSVVTGVLGHATAVPGLLLGTVASIVYFLLMCYRIKRSAELPPIKAVTYMRVGWFIRMGFVALLLTVSLKIKEIEFWAAVLGLFSLQIVIIINAAAMVAKSLGRRQR